MLGILVCRSRANGIAMVGIMYFGIAKYGIKEVVLFDWYRIVRYQYSDISNLARPSPIHRVHIHTKRADLTYKELLH